MRFDHIHFALKARTHGPTGTVHQRAHVGDASLTKFLVFTHAAGKNALHRSRIAGVLGGRCKQFIEVGARPEFALKSVVQCFDPTDRKSLRKIAAQLAIETSISSSMTNCTTRLALSTMC